MSNFAIIPAAGNGERLNDFDSKILAMILGKPLLCYTLDIFEESEKIDEIILVIRKKDCERIEEEVINKNRYKKIKKIVTGGLTRQESVYNGLKAITEKDGIVCIHDGVRPLIKKWMIEKSIENIGMTDNRDGVILAVPATDTIKIVKLSDMVVEKTVDRNRFWNVQTPQTFKLGRIRELYKRAIEEDLMVTDDASILEYYGGKVGIIRGSEENIKITTIVDLRLAEVLLKKYYYNG
jgi:2-C-methyl-D-erythritol 4-phosphate cytidylyltransferase